MAAFKGCLALPPDTTHMLQGVCALIITRFSSRESTFNVLNLSIVV